VELELGISEYIQDVLIVDEPEKVLVGEEFRTGPFNPLAVLEGGRGLRVWNGCEGTVP